MDTLPNELLMKILVKLDEQNLKTCLEVCSRWKDIISDAIGVQRFIGTSKGDCDGDYLPCFNIQEIKETGINTLVVHDIGDEEFPDYHNSYLMKRLVIAFPIRIDTFNKLTTPLKNLRELSLHLEALTKFNFGEAKAWLTFPNLTFFRIFGDDEGDEFLAGLESHDTLRANFLTLFLDTNFPRLDTLVLLALPLISDIEEDHSLEQALIVLLSKHQNTLRTFVFLNSAKHLKHSENIPVIPMIHNKIRLRLRTYNFYSDVILESQVDKFFQRIFPLQTNLRHYFNITSNFSPNLIQRNSSSLVTLDLGFTPGFEGVIDCEIFVRCSALKSMSLLGKIRPGLPGNNKRYITNTRCLPNSMESIRIVDFLLTKADAYELVTKKWSMLEFLELQNTGYYGNFGIPFEAFCILDGAKNVKHVFISNGINKRSIYKVIEEFIDVHMTTPPDLVYDLFRYIKQTRTRDVKFRLDQNDNYILIDWIAEGKIYSPKKPDHMYIHGVSMREGRRCIYLSLPNF